MWELQKPEPVKFFCGILAADEDCLQKSKDVLRNEFGETDLESDIWDFVKTEYYKHETGDTILRQFVSFKDLIDPGELAEAKLKTNEMEKNLASKLRPDLPRPVNLDPGIIEPSKLILASTKNFAQRIYIGKNIWAEITLSYRKAGWKIFDYTYPDYRQEIYHKFFDKVRTNLKEELKK
jgi:hypothetical protein